MKMSKLTLSLALLVALAAAPLFGLGTVDQVGGNESSALATGTAQSVALVTADEVCSAEPAQGPELFPVPFFLQPPTGCYSCQNHSDCRSYCGGYGACFPDDTFGCSLSPFDKFCFC